MIENSRAAGVRFMQGGEVIEARTKGEVVLCAGSIGSTQVLHRSGIGPADWLSPLGIDVVFDKPGVGRNLQDHPAATRDLPGRGRPHAERDLLQSISTRHDGDRLRVPPPRSADHGAVATRHLPPAPIRAASAPTSSSTCSRCRSTSSAIRLHRFPAITVSACNLQPTSRGTVRIRSSKADEAPSIAPKLSLDR